MRTAASNAVEANICLPPLVLMVQTESSSDATDCAVCDVGLTYSPTVHTAVF